MNSGITQAGFISFICMHTLEIEVSVYAEIYKRPYLQFVNQEY